MVVTWLIVAILYSAVLQRTINLTCNLLFFVNQLMGKNEQKMMKVFIDVKISVHDVFMLIIDDYE